MIQPYSEDRSFFSGDHTTIAVVATKEALIKPKRLSWFRWFLLQIFDSLGIPLLQISRCNQGPTGARRDSVSQEGSVAGMDGVSLNSKSYDLKIR